MHTSQRLTVLVALAAASSPALAQLQDLQDGRNFPAATETLGTDHATGLALGDIDHDGDLDVVVAHGGGYGPQINRVYLNAGGKQGGLPGTFLDGTATHFAGLPDDRSRDIDLADLDGDCDLDLFVSNEGQPTSVGGVSRIHLNQGGLQHGQAGHYAEATDAAWGQLVSVPVVQQVFGGDAGPYFDFSCDCEFGDLDDDGDLDLFHTSYGPALAGDRDSRVFLNDGLARFDELWPWADGLADTALATLDVDLADLDGDLDLDVLLSSRFGQARVFRNDLDLSTGTWGTSPFTDVTQSALLDPGAASVGGLQYESEIVDVDGDGDFDVYATNYDQLADRILRNDGDCTFTLMPDWINFDPLGEDSEPALIDFDADADLDILVANTTGANPLFVSGHSQGYSGSDLYSRNGTGLYPHNETPHLAAGASLATVCADMDDDGDPDVLLANANGQWSHYWENLLGVADTHAPRVLRLTEQADKSDGSDTAVRVQIADNAGPGEIRLYTVALLYQVDAGLERRLPMHWQGGQQFRAVIPGGHDGTIAYRVLASDRAGNTVVSETVVYAQQSPSAPPIQVVGSGTHGSLGVPHLALAGSLMPDTPLTLQLCNGSNEALLILFGSLASTPLAFKGGLLHTLPVALQLSLGTDALGQLRLDTVWPVGLPTGTQAWFQAGMADPGGPGGVVLSNAVQITTP